MHWKRKESKPAVAYERLVYSTSQCPEDRPVQKGYVPVLVGQSDDGLTERFAVHVRLLKEPCMAALLEMAAQEYGYKQEGILRIPCDVEHFRQVMGVISKVRL